MSTTNIDSLHVYYVVRVVGKLAVWAQWAVSASFHTRNDSVYGLLSFDGVNSLAFATLRCHFIVPEAYRWWHSWHSLLRISETNIHFFTSFNRLNKWKRILSSDRSYNNNCHNIIIIQRAPYSCCSCLPLINFMRFLLWCPSSSLQVEERNGMNYYWQFLMGLWTQRNDEKRGKIGWSLGSRSNEWMEQISNVGIGNLPHTTDSLSLLSVNISCSFFSPPVIVHLHFLEPMTQKRTITASAIHSVKSPPIHPLSSLFCLSLFSIDLVKRTLSIPTEKNHIFDLSIAQWVCVFVCCDVKMCLCLTANYSPKDDLLLLLRLFLPF